jgi:hypothetical protein
MDDISYERIAITDVGMVMTAIPAGVAGRFVARDKFVINTKDGSRVKILFLHNNFRAWFLSGEGKIEDVPKAQALRCSRTLEASLDRSLINTLLGEERAETLLCEMFSLMERQKNGEEVFLWTAGAPMSSLSATREACSGGSL